MIPILLRNFTNLSYKKYNVKVVYNGFCLIGNVHRNVSRILQIIVSQILWQLSY